MLGPTRVPLSSAVLVVHRSVLRHARRWLGALSIAAFQAVPVAVSQNQDGKLSISFGYGSEAYLQQSFGCEGNVIDERRGRLFHQRRHAAQCVWGE
jgi:hypothetical protein